MAEQIVIGLFDALGTAEDVRNRLVYEGVPEADIALRVLKQVEPMPPSMAPETSKFAVDILFSTTVREKYAPLIRDGETAVSSAHTPRRRPRPPSTPCGNSRRSRSTGWIPPRSRCCCRKRPPRRTSRRADDSGQPRSRAASRNAATTRVTAASASCG